MSTPNNEKDYAKAFENCMKPTSKSIKGKRTRLNVSRILNVVLGVIILILIIPTIKYYSLKLNENKKIQIETNTVTTKLVTLDSVNMPYATFTNDDATYIVQLPTKTLDSLKVGNTYELTSANNTLIMLNEIH